MTPMSVTIRVGVDVPYNKMTDTLVFQIAVLLAFDLARNTTSDHFSID